MLLMRRLPEGIEKERERERERESLGETLCTVSSPWNRPRKCRPLLWENWDRRAGVA